MRDIRQGPKTLFNQCIQILTKIKLTFILNIFNNGSSYYILQRSSFTRGEGGKGLKEKLGLNFFVIFLRFFFSSEDRKIRKKATRLLSEASFCSISAMS